MEVGTCWSGWSGAQPDGRCLPLLIFPCTIKSRSSLLAPPHLGGPGKRAVKRLWCGVLLFPVPFVMWIPVTTFVPLQRILITTAWYLICDRATMWPQLSGNYTYWLPAIARIKYKLCLLAHKETVGQAPKYIEYIADFLTPVAEFSSPSAFCTPRVISRKFRRPEAKTENRRTCFFCRGTASVESAAESVKTCADQPYCSSASLKRFCSPHYTEYLKTETFELCDAPSVNLASGGRVAIQILTNYSCNL